MIMIVLMGVALTGLAVAYVFRHRSIGEELIVALLFALFVTSYNTYEYETTNFLIGDINLYPLVLWTGGLVLLREVYKQVQVPQRFFIVSGLYLVALFALEYLGYYWLGIRTTGHLPSLFNLGIIHGSLFIHAFYLLAGPVYLLVTNYLRIR